MAFQTVKLIPGVRVEQTPLLLEAGIASSNLIRFRDGLPEKIGGWQREYSGSIPGPIRDILAYMDTDLASHVGLAGDSGWYELTSGTLTQIQASTSQSDTAGVQIPYLPAVLTASNVSFWLGPGPTPFTEYDGVFILDHIFFAFANLTAGEVTRVLIMGGYAVANVIDPPTNMTAQCFIANFPVTKTGTDPSVLTIVQGDVYYSTVAGSHNVWIYIMGTPPGGTLGFVGHDYKVGDSWEQAFPFALGGITLAKGFYTITSIDNGSGGTHFFAGTGGASEPTGIPVSAWFTVYSPTAATSSVPGPNNVIPPTWGDTGAPGVNVIRYHQDNSGAPIAGPTWTQLGWGDELIACPNGGAIYKWSEQQGPSAQVIGPAPHFNTGIFLAMPQQMIVAYGADVLGVQDPMQIAWCDVANHDVWKADVSNQAGTYRLPRGSLIVGGMQGPQQALLWTDLAVWAMTYIGYPDVWGFGEIGHGCGLIGQHAMCSAGPQVFWMGKSKFWTFNNNAVVPLQCEVWDTIFQDFNLNLRQKIACGSNANFNEAVWFYSRLSTGTTENDAFVKFNWVTGEWDYGSLEVSAWIENNIMALQTPLSTMTLPGDATSYLMSHETGQDADGIAIDWWFETGLFMLAEGEQFMFVDRMFPDMKWGLAGGPKSASILVTLKSFKYPEATPSVYGPFTMTASSNEVDPRARGRYFSIRIEGDDLGTFARLGAFKFRFAPDGRSG